MIANPPNAVIAGVKFSVLDRQGVAQALLDACLSRRGGYVCVTGAHGVVHSQEHAGFQNILNGAMVNCVDGQPSVWLLRLKGIKLAHRVTGRELLFDIMDLDTCHNIRHVFYGSTKNVTDRMTARFLRRDPCIDVGQAANPPFGPIDRDALEEFCASTESEKPTIIWVGLSTPKQEQIALVLSHRLPKVIVIAIGAGFDFAAGLLNEAPSVLTKMGLEWLFRLICEPRRLWPRYSYIVTRFLRLSAIELSHHARSH